MGMAENYKHLYEQMKKMVGMYQDEIVPGMRKTIEDMEQNHVKVVRCKDCKYYTEQKKRCDHPCQEAEDCYDCWLETEPADFCSCGEIKVNCDIAENIENCEDCGFCAMLERKHNG